jgi:photosystem II stability/assembly factor-like uncharacterized protein
MSQPGLFHTRNDGLKWTRAAARGLGAEIKALAVHPGIATVVAAGTADGLYLSRDAGEQFERLVVGQQVLAVTFDLDGQRIWFSGHNGRATLARIDRAPGAKPETLDIPAMSDDAVAYIAQNPVRRNEITIATFRRSVFVSKDAGRTWTAIAQDGVTRASEAK